MWYHRLPFLLPKTTLLEKKKQPVVTFTKIGYPKRLGLRQVEFTLQPWRTVLLVPRRWRLATRKEEMTCYVHTAVTFTDQTTLEYHRHYAVTSVDDAVRMAEKDLFFMLELYIAIDQQRYGKKRGP